MTFGLRCSGPACRPHPASLPVRVPTVESLPPASFGFPLAVAPCGLATVAVIGPDWLLSSNKTLPMLGTPRGRPPGRPDEGVPLVHFFSPGVRATENPPWNTAEAPVSRRYSGASGRRFFSERPTTEGSTRKFLPSKRMYGEPSTRTPAR